MKRSNIFIKLLLLTAVVSIGLSTQVSAIGTTFMDSTADTNGDCDTWDQYGQDPKCGTNPTRLLAGETTTVPEARVQVRAYFYGLTGADGQVDSAKVAAQDPSVNFPGWSFCSTKKTSWNTNDVIEHGWFDVHGIVANVGLTDFNVGGELRSSAQWRSSTSDYCDPSEAAFTKRIPVKASTLKPVRGVAGLLGVDVVVEHNPYVGGACKNNPQNAYCDGMFNSFSINVTQTRPAGVAAPFVTNVAQSAGQQVADGNGVTLQNEPVEQSNANSNTYRLRFGSDCSIPEGGYVTKRIQFYDLDWFPNAPAGNEPIRVRLYKIKRDGTDAKWKKPGTWTSGDNSGLTPAQEWGTTRPSYSKDVDNTGPGWADIIPSWNGGIRSYYFHAQRDYKYIVDVLNNNNGLVFQWGLPFDGVYYLKSCKESVEPSASLDKNRYEAGDTVSALASIENTGATTATVSYRREFWSSNNSSWSAGPGSAPGNQVHRTYSTSQAVDGGGAPPYVLAGPHVNWQTAANGAFNYVCTKLTITNPLDEDGNQKSDGQCSPIGKYPSLQTNGGDVRSGGAVPSGTTCNSFGAGSIIGHIYGVTTKGSYGQYAALAGGELTNFGSANLPSANAFSNQLFFGAKTAYSPVIDDDGYFYLRGSESPGATSSTTHCLPALDGVYASTGASTTVGAGSSLVTLSAGASLRNEYTFSANSGGVSTLNVSGVTLSASQKVSLRVNGPTDCSTGTYIVRLTGDIKRTAVASIPQVPWFSLVATSPCIRVVVSDSVKELYGLYATEGDMTTCQATSGNGFDDTDDNQYGNDPSLHLQSDDCVDRLTINGAVIVGSKLHTYRTFSDGSIGNAAEVFNLDPSFTVSDYVRSRDSKAFRVESQMELPPRF